MTNFEKWVKAQILTTYGTKKQGISELNSLTIGSVLKLYADGFIFPVSNGQVDIQLEV